MEYLDILKSLKSGQYAPIYFLHGEEAYFIDRVSDYIEHHVLEESEKAFNQIVMYGKETDFKQVLDQAMQFPMMASHRVVILKEAQSMSSLDKLADYFKNPSAQTILVISHKHKSFDKRKKAIWTSLKKTAVILESKKLYDNQLPAFISGMAKEYNLQINPKVSFIMAEHLGNDLAKISNELGKLKLNLEAGSEVSSEDIQNFIGISKDYNIFELQKAIGTRNKKKAYSIVKYFADNKKSHPIQMHVGSLYNYFSSLLVAKKYSKSDDRNFAKKAGINPYFASEYKAAARNYTPAQLKRAFSLLFTMDKSSKGIESRHSNDIGIYQEFLFRLFAD